MGEAMVLHLVKEGYWNNLESFCNDTYKRTSDPLYLFWRGFAQYQLGNPSAAINDLLGIQQKKEVAYACIVALLFYQNQARNIDRVPFPPPRNKSTTSAPANDSSAETQPRGLSPRPYTSSPSSRRAGRPMTSSNKKATPAISGLQLPGATSSAKRRKDSPARLTNSSTGSGRRRIKIYPRPPSSWPGPPRRTTRRSTKMHFRPSMRVSSTTPPSCPS